MYFRYPCKQLISKGAELNRKNGRTVARRHHSNESKAVCSVDMSIKPLEVSPISDDRFPIVDPKCLKMSRVAGKVESWEQRAEANRIMLTGPFFTAIDRRIMCAACTLVKSEPFGAAERAFTSHFLVKTQLWLSRRSV
jgi:hypothetical protein